MVRGHAKPAQTKQMQPMSVTSLSRQVIRALLIKPLSHRHTASITDHHSLGYVRTSWLDNDKKYTIIYVKVNDERLDWCIVLVYACIYMYPCSANGRCTSLPSMVTILYIYIL